MVLVILTLVVLVVLVPLPLAMLSTLVVVALVSRLVMFSVWFKLLVAMLLVAGVASFLQWSDIMADEVGSSWMILARVASFLLLLRVASFWQESLRNFQLSLRKFAKFGQMWDCTGVPQYGVPCCWCFWVFVAFVLLQY